MGARYVASEGKKSKNTQRKMWPSKVATLTTRRETVENDVNTETILKIIDNFDIRHALEIASEYTEKVSFKSSIPPFCPENDRVLISVEA